MCSAPFPRRYTLMWIGLWRSSYRFRQFLANPKSDLFSDLFTCSGKELLGISDTGILPVMLSLETVSCLKTVLRQFCGVLVLVLRVGVLVLGWCLGPKSKTVWQPGTLATNHVSDQWSPRLSCVGSRFMLLTYCLWAIVNTLWLLKDDFDPDDRPNI